MKLSSNTIRKALITLFAAMFLAGFAGKIVLDAYYIENRPREPVPAEGRIYPKSLKVTYGATVYLTENESWCVDLIVPVTLFCVLVGGVLQTYWKKS